MNEESIQKEIIEILSNSKGGELSNLGTDEAKIFELLSRLPRNSPLLDRRSHEKFTMLQYAAARGSAKTVRALLSKGARHISICNHPVHIACKFGHFEVYQTFFNQESIDNIVCTCVTFPAVHEDAQCETNSSQYQFLFPKDYAIANNHSQFINLDDAEDQQIMKKYLKIALRFGAAECIQKLFPFVNWPKEATFRFEAFAIAVKSGFHAVDLLIQLGIEFPQSRENLGKLLRNFLLSKNSCLYRIADNLPNILKTFHVSRQNCDFEPAEILETNRNFIYKEAPLLTNYHHIFPNSAKCHGCSPKEIESVIARTICLTEAYKIISECEEAS